MRQISWSIGSFPRQSLDGIFRYGGAALFLLLAFTLRNQFTPLVGDRVPFMFFAPAALVSAWVCGLGPGLAAFFSGIALGQYFFIHPYNALWPNSKVGLLILAPYLITTLIAILFIHAWRKATQRAAAIEQLANLHAASLKEQVVERKRVEELLRQVVASSSSLQSCLGQNSKSI